MTITPMKKIGMLKQQENCKKKIKLKEVDFLLNI